MQEIERTYLLDALPALPGTAERWRLEQGYLPERKASAGETADHSPEGRLRRITAPDGRTRLEHTIKRGSGLVRSEEHLAITPERFEQLWPLTRGRRLAKTRYRVPCDDGNERRVWEIDDFDDLELVLAEVELPEANAAAPIPGWLSPHIIREITNEKQYRNYELALHLAKMSGRPDH